MILSLLRLRARRARAPWSTRLLAAWLALTLVFALTPCCDVIGPANAAPVPVAADHGHTPDAHGDMHAPDAGGDPCATWLDRSDAVTPKTDIVAPFVAKVAIATPFVFLWNVPSAAIAWRPFRLSASPPDALYLRYARLIL
ncbi:MAG TPA: hypothetical protein VJB18_02120 [Burkholderiales bacterium]|nr:hypothetical protein [Burkholderiales bacterium]